MRSPFEQGDQPRPSLKTERCSAEVISLTEWAASRRRSEPPSWDQHALDLQPYQRDALAWLERQDALNANDLWAAQAATAYLGDRIAMPAAAIEAAFDARTGRFDLPAYVANTLDGAPAVLPLPQPPVGVITRLLRRLH
ncbi:hypothetical protein CA606_18375 [Caulobacter vibrioides]|uniref:Uncharacterized protein n=1 Tax=Caulobacter vibrioides TaxID=155892 RepID=A0A290MQ70_CAUVI|nr:hypothetical protein [Caulobacter vibrioides]ATC34140.1 hypothetical protein CA606_18375 [Caulobacter vibrioides]